jgi:hypothetical protein
LLKSKPAAGSSLDISGAYVALELYLFVYRAQGQDGMSNRRLDLGNLQHESSPEFRVEIPRKRYGGSRAEEVEGPLL